MPNDHLLDWDHVVWPPRRSNPPLQLPSYDPTLADPIPHRLAARTAAPDNSRRPGFSKPTLSASLSSRSKTPAPTTSRLPTAAHVPSIPFSAVQPKRVQNTSSPASAPNFSSHSSTFDHAHPRRPSPYSQPSRSPYHFDLHTPRSDPRATTFLMSPAIENGRIVATIPVYGVPPEMVSDGGVVEKGWPKAYIEALKRQKTDHHHHHARRPSLEKHPPPPRQPVRHPPPTLPHDYADSQYSPRSELLSPQPPSPPQLVIHPPFVPPRKGYWNRRGDTIINGRIVPARQGETYPSDLKDYPRIALRNENGDILYPPAMTLASRVDVWREED